MIDANYADVSLLLPLLGEEGATNFVDFSLHNRHVTPTASGTGPVVSSAQSVFNGVSGAFSPLLGGLNIEGQEGDGFQTGDLTVEAWFWLSSSADALVDQFIINLPQDIYITFIDSDAYLTARLNFSTHNSIITQEQWHHVAVTYASGTWRLFLNGSLVSLREDSPRDFGADLPTINVGHKNALMFFTGYLSDIRVTKGVARYIGAFTPPGALVKRVSGAVTGADGGKAARTVVAVPRAYPERVYATESSATTGEYTLWVPDGEVTRIVCANESMILNDHVDRVIPG